MAELRGGTSGYACKEWKGSFYPEKLPDREMLGFCGQQLRTVEINHTFYRIPTEKVLEAWAESVPLGFHFVLKANQKITHIQQLRDCRETLRRFLETASVLARRELLGPILFQLPPTFRADAALLEDFLQLRPRAFPFALEVRHPSLHTDHTSSLLPPPRPAAPPPRSAWRKPTGPARPTSSPPTLSPPASAGPPTPRRSWPPGSSAARPGSGRAWTSTFSSSMKTPGRPRPTRAGS